MYVRTLWDFVFPHGCVCARMCAACPIYSPGCPICGLVRVCQGCSATDEAEAMCTLLVSVSVCRASFMLPTLKILICPWTPFCTRLESLGVLVGLCQFSVVQCCTVIPWLNAFNRSSSGNDGKSQQLAGAPDLLKVLYFKKHEGL